MDTIGDLLRQWRHRRRLSQLDLAIAADVSARHVSLVETGKSNPSAAMVLRLADHLDVPLRERNRLLLAAGFAPRYAERPLDDAALSAARNAVERVLRAHEPYPALAFDRRWNIIMTNRAVDPFLAEVDPELLRPPVNLLRLGLDPRGLARLVVNLADVRAVFRSRVRRQLAAAPDPELAALYAELLEPGGGDARGRRRHDPDDRPLRGTGAAAVLHHHHVRHAPGHHAGRGRRRVVLPGGRRERLLVRRAHGIRTGLTTLPDVVSASASLIWASG
ncbi:helix-turn-helix domain-containing protein [Actinomadura luteofluorescens]|uniref:helix-turn-helix domain-containing protein n=1 Tax=Actinomadura luteofluorescens TaxID=46163 RepID=UPI003627AA46